MCGNSLLLKALTVVPVVSAMTGVAHAASYPEKPIRFIVAFAAGGSIDLLARLFAQKLTEGLAQQVVVDNRLAPSAQ